MFSKSFSKLLYLQVFFVAVIHNRKEDRHENIGVYQDIYYEENSKETTVVVSRHPIKKYTERMCQNFSKDYMYLV